MDPFPGSLVRFLRNPVWDRGLSTQYFRPRPPPPSSPAKWAKATMQTSPIVPDPGLITWQTGSIHTVV